MTRMGEAKDFKCEPSRWHHVLTEMKGGESIVQSVGGPVLCAKHEGFTRRDCVCPTLRRSCIRANCGSVLRHEILLSVSFKDYK